ncbi:putative transposase [Yersinia pestis biovar Medievalis str. Harbin 35]|uniref:tyrosine-type recombinase/integrase n=6 Tax=Yersinia pestis TaxID=632 RepID=UPI0001F56073|nr:tyrosine-type recombinase/integrase [Yersinia pestis]ADV98807.1 putative transposase [Yersinia pestis biovar Medievalis str. Harbin 35]AJJ43273.1 phage integrase family protein [Yersinia pestis]AJK06891.1 phage integrase family protein [Yersinia pestis]
MWITIAPFVTPGQRVRENLGVPDTAKNRRMAGELRESVRYTIKIGNFNYAAQFPNSKQLHKFGVAQLNVTVSQLAEKWLALKVMEITKNGISRYRSYIKICAGIIGEERLVSSITNEMVLSLRKELLTGFQIAGVHQKTRQLKKGRSVRTVNVYLSCFAAMMEFAVANGYIERSPFVGISPLKKSKSEPDPLTRDEYARLMEVAPSLQVKNIWKLAVSTGMRHGEICALAWEDIDLKEWTITISRNMAVVHHFTPPKTESGNRTIKLTNSAIEALKEQMALTKMGKKIKVDVHLREFGKIRKDDCTFVFSPRLSARNGKGGDWYSPGVFSGTWNFALKKAGIRHRKAYETRHTFACWALSAGANPNFVANQMGHTSSQMVYSVYGKWMSENNSNQMDILNARFTGDAPYMPRAISQ